MFEVLKNDAQIFISACVQELGKRFGHREESEWRSVDDDTQSILERRDKTHESVVDVDLDTICTIVVQRCKGIQSHGRGLFVVPDGGG